MFRISAEKAHLGSFSCVVLALRCSAPAGRSNGQQRERQRGVFWPRSISHSAELGHSWHSAPWPSEALREVSGQLAVENFCCGLGDVGALDCW